jgi:hypothetical protein
MAWYGLISAALGVLAIVTTLASADRVGLMARPALARLLVLGSSGLIWAGILVAIVGLATPSAAAEAGAAATWWPGELAGGLAVLALAFGVVMIGMGLISWLELSGPLPFGVALVTVAIVMWIVGAAWASPAAAQAQVQLTSTICGPAGEITAELQRVHGVRPIGGGALDEGHAALVLASPDGQRWSILMIQARTGAGCVVLAGSDWDPGVLPGTGR